MDESDNQTTIPTTNVESFIKYEPLSEDGTPKMDTPFSIRVISIRRVNHDPDGVSAKAVLDGLVHAGFFSDDSAKQVKQISFESRKTRKGEEEQTIIILDTEEDVPNEDHIEGLSQVRFY